ncbi:ATP-binding protein [Sediminicola luteus]|uniref:histidine kinase n=1 Tax=Sediminicola luteus TaxID=319238 RepID=A0ABV2TWF6_9FLAO
MIKKLVLALVVFNCFMSFGQEAWLDSIAIYRDAEAKLDSIEIWEGQATKAQQVKDLDTEMMALYNILDTKVMDFNNLNRSVKYKEFSRLETLILQNPTHPTTKKIIAGFYSLLGLHSWFQRYAKKINEGVIDEHLTEKAIESLEKSQKLAKEENNWKLYYEAKIFLDGNLKGYSLKENLKWMLEMETELLEKDQLEALPRLYAAIGFTYRFLGENLNAITYYEKYITKEQPKWRLNRSLVHLSNIYMELNKPEISLYYAQRSLYFAEAYDTQLNLEVHAHLGNAYLMLNNLKKAQYHYDKHQILLDDLNTTRLEILQNKVSKAIAANDVSAELIARIDLAEFKTWDLGDMELSYVELLAVQNLMDENSQFKELPEAIPFYIHLGLLLNYQEKFVDSEFYLDKGYALAKKNKAKSPVIYYDAAFRLIQLYGRNGDKNSLLNFYPQIEKEILEKGDRSELFQAAFYGFLGGGYMELKEYETALIYTRKSIAAKEIALPYVIQSQIYLALKQLDAAIFSGKRGLILLKANNSHLDQWFAHKSLGVAYRQLGHFENALYHLSEFERLDAKLFSGESAYRVGIIDQEREKEKAALKSAINNQKYSSQRKILWLVGGGAILFALGLFFILNRLKVIRKQNKIIASEKERAEQSEKYKEKFLANMSHEIRTPMHAISGMLNTLKRQKHPKSQDRYLNAMRISSDSLLVLLNDILDLSKIESGNLDMVQVKMNVHEIVDNVIGLLRFKAEEKGLVLTKKIPDDFPKSIIGDPGRLRQILLNLVGNALKFTEKGSVEIEISEIEDQVKIAINDTGKGIPKEEFTAIFNSFHQGSIVRNGIYGGTGLGLAISRQLVELQGGKIWVESKEKVGSSFFVQLPLILAEEGKALKTGLTETELKALGEQMPGLSLLIAEDNEFNIMVVRDDLEWYIPEVKLTFAQNGLEAVDAFKKKSFDLVLMDVQMPEMNGYEATKEIRKYEAIKKNETSTPIIAMTASLMKEQISSCYVAGMDGYIPKPYKPEELINALYNISIATPIGISE